MLASIKKAVVMLSKSPMGACTGSATVAGGLSATACGRPRVLTSAASSLASPSAALQTVWSRPDDPSNKRLHMNSSKLLGRGGFAAFAGSSPLVSHHIRRQTSQKGFHVSAKAEDAEPLDYPVTPAEAKPVYATLAALQLLLALPHFVSPEMAADIIFASTAYPLNVLQIPLHKLMGTGYLAAAIAFWTLKGGAERMELHKPVYQRLNLGLITFSVALMGVMGGNIELLRPWALLVGTAECSAAATIPAWFYAATSGHSLQPITVIKNVFKDLGWLLHVTGFKSAAYSLLSVTFFGAAAAYLAAPEATLTGVLTYARSRDCILLWQAVGAAALMLPAWTLSLKEAADTWQLHAPAFKTLNLGLAFIGLAHVMTLMPWWTPCSSGPYMPYVIAAWGLAAATGTWGFLSSAPPVIDNAF
ncbi:g8410 [Coccomyxa elongata]